MPSRAGSSLLVSAVAFACITAALSKTITVNWSREFASSDPSKGVFNATCGDVATFTWTGFSHNVVQTAYNASEPCQAVNVTEIAPFSMTGGINATFTKDGIYHYICQANGHCPAGQHVTFFVSGCTTSPSPSGGGKKGGGKKGGGKKGGGKKGGGKKGGGKKGGGKKGGGKKGDGKNGGGRVGRGKNML